MTQKWISRALISLSCLFLLASIWPFSTQAQERTLNLYIWSEYLDPQIVTDFEEQTNSRVVISTYESNEDMVAKLQGGGVSQYDIVVPSDYIVPTMIQADLLQPLDKDQLPNLENLDSAFVDLPFDPDSTYTAAYQWGTTGLGYRQDQVPEAFERSWGVIFDPEQQLGPFTLIDDQRPMVSAAAVYLGFDKNTTDPDDLRQVQALLLETKQRSAGFVGGVGGKNQLLTGTAVFAIVYSGDVLQASEENPDVDYFIPREGGEIWLDTLAIPAQAPHPELAHEFINTILDPEVGAQLSNYNRFATPNQASKPMIAPEDLANPMIYPDEETMQVLVFNKVLTSEEMRLLDALWTNVKSG